MTVHFMIDNPPGSGKNLTIKVALLAFQRIKGSHTGEHLCDVVTALLLRAGIDPTKVCFFPPLLR